MTWVVVGLGNPDEEHVRTRHNAGRMAVEYFAKAKKLGEWKEDPGTTARKRAGYGAGKKSRAFVTRGAIGKELVVCVLPDTYMNNSGDVVAHFIKPARHSASGGGSQKSAEKLVVLYDDLDLPFGKMKISFDRGSGGHKGIDSIMRAVKTRRFARIRIGISKVDGKGAPQKPQGEKVVEKFILGEFSSNEFSQLKDLFKRTAEAIETIILDGREKAMNVFN